MIKSQPLIGGISGASGIIYGIWLLIILRELAIETHLIMSRAAEITLAHETDLKVAAVRRLATQAYAVQDVAVLIFSGSFRTAGMIVALCPIRSVSEIATGVIMSLLTRGADVTLKKRRLLMLMLMLRVKPLHTGRLRMMLALSKMGAIIAPPVPAFYGKAETLEAMVYHTVGRVLDLFGIDAGIVRRWGRVPSSSKKE